MDFFKTYDSGHLYGAGRIIVISTAHQSGAKFIIETFALSYYDDKIFKGRLIEYNFDASEIITDELEIQAKSIALQILTEKYKSSKDISILNQTLKLTEIPKSILISLKGQNLHIDVFKDISKKTNCVSFSDYLNNILSFPPIVIKDYQ